MQSHAHPGRSKDDADTSARSLEVGVEDALVCVSLRGRGRDCRVRVCVFVRGMQQLLGRRRGFYEEGRGGGLSVVWSVKKC